MVIVFSARERFDLVHSVQILRYLGLVRTGRIVDGKSCVAVVLGAAKALRLLGFGKGRLDGCALLFVLLVASQD